MRITKVTIISTAPEPDNNINDLLLLFGTSLGLFGIRDKDKSCYRVFITLVKALKHKIELTSDELAAQTGLTRGTVVHHLNRLMEAGIVTNYRNKYFIDYPSLEDLVIHMKQGVDVMFDKLQGVAREIDDKLDL